MNYLIPLFLVFLANTALAQQASTKGAWLEKWENSKNYLIEIAEAMPEDAYDFKPAPRQMSFKEQLMHIKSNMDWLSTDYFTDVEYQRTKIDLPSSKKETIGVLSEAFEAAATVIGATAEDSLHETVDFFSGPKSKLQILNLLQDHVTHHRGQLIVYLNLNGVAPPSYSGW